MQNVAYAGRDGHIAIRSTGHLPIRRGGHGRGLLDGTTTDGEWTGRIPFNQLPYSRDPEQGYLFSANQKPTNEAYPYYQNHDWRDGWRSIRIDSLLSGKETHSVNDLKAYLADVDVQQRDAFVPLMQTAGNVSPEARQVREMLIGWDGVASLDRPEPLAMDIFLSELRRLMWDEDAFEGEDLPEDAVLIRLVKTNPQSPWFDIQDTDPTEAASELVRQALVNAADTLYAAHGDDPSEWRWGDHHTVIFRHLTRSEQLKPLWRGPMPYPGFDATVSPARGRQATHSASQRLVIDFSGETTRAYGVVPGGQSGNPLHPSYYDDQLDTYVNFELYPLHLPETPGAIPDSTTTGTLSISP
jgi:penicillin amidase